MFARTPGGVWLSSVALGLALFAPACGDDGGTAAGGGGGTTTTGATATSGGSPTSGGSGPGGSGQGGSGQGGSEQGGSGQGGSAGGGQTTATGGGGGGAGGGGVGGDGTGGDGGTTGEGGAPPAGARLRVVAANLTSGNNQSWDPGHGKRILQGLDGDVLLIQEMKVGNNSAAALRDFADDVCGTSCDVAREPMGGAGDLPNGIVSRHPIVSSGFWDDPRVANREFFWARVDLPGGRDLLAISAHFLTSSAANRRAEAVALLAELQDAADPDDLVVLGADLNTDTRDEGALDVLSAFFRTGGPWPVDTEGLDGTNASRSKPYDWVLANDTLDALEVAVTIGARTFPSGFVVDTRTYSPIADLAPALVNDSGAPSMQHMAVVRDFAYGD